MEEADILGLSYFDELELTPSPRAKTKRKSTDLVFIPLDELLEKQYKTLKRVNKNNLKTLQRPLMLAFLRHLEDKTSQLTSWLIILHNIAVKYKGQITVAIADYNEIGMLIPGINIYSYSFSATAPPQVYAIDGNERRYQLKKYIVGLESIDAFGRKLLKDELFFSQPIPAENNNLVKVVVASNFEQLVLKNECDIFIVFYMEWCRFSQEFLPQLDELALILKEDNIQFMKMDVENNYLAVEYNVVALPTCSFIRKTDKNSYIKFNQQRSNENVIKFIATHSTEELKNYDREGNKKE